MVLYVQYIDIDGIVYHHCSSFLFIAQVDFNIRKKSFFWATFNKNTPDIALPIYSINTKTDVIFIWENTVAFP